ncbi:hypothetical protein [Marinobacterium litorale]|uniref:hypothetical protein n=1 Tax=Marinobacterium litorale TaxID=404770 RepID=UPI00048755CD|nr:hypothetical protein [Marinobacterium litorale]
MGEILLGKFKTWCQPSETTKANWAIDYLKRHPLSQARGPAVELVPHSATSEPARSEYDHVLKLIDNADDSRYENHERLGRLKSGWRNANFRNKKNLKPTSFLLDIDTHRALATLANARNTTKTDVVRQLIEDAEEFRAQTRAHLKNELEDAYSQRSKQLRRKIDSDLSIDPPAKRKEQELQDQLSKAVTAASGLYSLLMENATAPEPHDAEKLSEMITNVLEPLPKALEKKITIIKGSA